MRLAKPECEYVSKDNSKERATSFGAEVDTVDDGLGNAFGEDEEEEEEQGGKIEGMLEGPLNCRSCEISLRCSRKR